MKKKILAVVMVALMLVVGTGAFIYHENHKLVLLGEDPVAEVIVKPIEVKSIEVQKLDPDGTITTWDNVPTQEWP